MFLGMDAFLKVPYLVSAKSLSTRLPIRYYHFESKPPRASRVAIFWDLDNKPPNSFPPYDAARRLKKAACTFGIVQYMVAYANHHAFRHVSSPVVRQQRKDRKVVNQPDGPYLCRVCGRKFWNNEKLVNHFKMIHEREQEKRLSQLESARGSRRVKLMARVSMKMHKYKNAVGDVLTPKVGYGLADELKRAGFSVNLVPDKPQEADIALRKHMVELMDQRRVECLVLVSDDSDFTDVIKEARQRCLKTVVVGDERDGALKICADASFSWKEIMLDKAKKEAVTVLGRWTDRDVLKRLEWTYKPDLEKREHDYDESQSESEDGDAERIAFGEGRDHVTKEDLRPWWELDSNVNDTLAKSFD